MTSTTTTATPVRRPRAGTWKIDPGHADVGFVGRHLGLTRVRGRFTGVDATVVIADELAGSSVDVAIDMASISSGDASRDAHLRSADLFDVEQYPTATFRSTGLTVDGSTGALSGELTIKGVTRPVTLAVDFLGEVTDPWGGERAIFSAGGRINREDWGITWNMPVPTGGLLVSKEIRLEIEVELVRS
jgi:polyisoprenoid-binding protein YceI